MAKIRGTEPGNNSRKNPRGRQSTYEDRRAQAELMWTDKELGMTHADIATKYEVAPRTVTNRFAEFPREGHTLSQINASGPVDASLEAVRTEEMWSDKIDRRMTSKQIAEKHGCSVETVRSRLSTFFPKKSMIALEKHRMREDDKLDMLEEAAMEILGKDHYVVDKGQVIFDPYTNQPLVDDAPKMAAMDRILKIIEAKRKLFGLDSPTRHEVKHSADTTIEIQEVADAVAEAHRRNEEKKLRMLKEKARELSSGEIVDAEVVEEE